MGDTVAVPVLLPDVSVSDLLRCHLGAGVRTGRFPVVKTSSRRATLLRRALLHNDNRKPLPGRRNRCKTPRKAAAQHQHITPDDLLLAHLIPIRPAVFSMLHIAFFSLFHSNIFHRHLLFQRKLSTPSTKLPLSTTQTSRLRNTAPRPGLQSGFHVEARQKFLVCRNLRYSQKSIV